MNWVKVALNMLAKQHITEQLTLHIDSEGCPKLASI